MCAYMDSLFAGALCGAGRRRGGEAGQDGAGWRWRRRLGTLGTLLARKVKLAPAPAAPTPPSPAPTALFAPQCPSPRRAPRPVHRHASPPARPPQVLPPLPPPRYTAAVAARAADSEPAQGSRPRDGAESASRPAGRSGNGQYAGKWADALAAAEAAVGCADDSARSAASTVAAAPAGHYFYHRPPSVDPGPSARPGAGPESVRGCGWSLSAGRAARRAQSARGLGGGVLGDEGDASVWTTGRAPASPHGPGPPRTLPAQSRRPP
jgi:hypothetical protein